MSTYASTGPFGVHLGFESVELPADTCFGAHPLAHQLGLVVLAIGLPLIGVERHEQLGVKGAVEEIVEVGVRQCVVTQLIALRVQRGGGFGGQTKFREREQLHRVDPESAVPVVVHTLEAPGDAAEQNRIRQYEHWGVRTSRLGP